MTNVIKFSDVKQEIGEVLSASIFQKNGFIRIEKKLEWLKVFPDVVQLVYVEKMRSDNIRARTFCIARVNDEITIGGNLTRAYVEGGDEGFVSSYLWCIENLDEMQSSLKDIAGVIKSVALPWFNQNTSFKDLIATKENFPDSAKYKIKLDEYEEAINSFNLREKDFIVDAPALNLDELVSLFQEAFLPYFEALGFKAIYEDKISLIRKRADVYDVLIIELVNYGLSIGVYAFNWVEKMAFDGSGEYSSDFAFLLNGGPISNSGIIAVDSGYSFLIGNENHRLDSIENLKLLIGNRVIPNLEQVENYDDFVLSIFPNMKSVASQLGIV